MSIDLINDNPKKYANSISIKDLEKLLRKLSFQYYNTGEPYVDDDIFDQLRDVLEERDQNNSFLTEVGALPGKKNKKAEKLPYPMSSLTKIQLGEENKLKIWLEKYNKGPYIISDKLDGASVQLYKDKNGNLFLYTRGNFVIGQNVSYLINTIFRDINLDKMPKSYSVRGELIIKKKDFDNLKTEKKNVRNSIPSLFTSVKSLDKNILNAAKFVAYSILFPIMTIEDQLIKLQDMGFDTVYYKKIKKINSEILSEMLLNRRDKSEYGIDGLVCVDNSIKYKPDSERPKYAFSFKMMYKDAIVTTEVLSVEWNGSKDNYLKPIVIIKPVLIEKSGNVTISKVTGYNARYIVDNKIGKGAIVELVRSNDVIPKIIKVIKGSKIDSLPNYDYKWTVNDEGEKVDIINTSSKSDVSDKITVSLILHFFRTMGVKYLSEGIIAKLVDNGYDSVEKILDADDNELEEINGLGDKNVKKIRDEIDKSIKNAELYTFMAASNIFGRGLGERKIKAVLKMYPNLLLEKWDEKTMKKKLLKVDGYQDKSVDLFVGNYKKFIKFYNKINNIYDISRYMEKIDEDNTSSDTDNNDNYFKDKIFVFTGFRDEQLKKFIEKNGGKVNTSVSKKTYMVITSGDDSSSKLNKAKDLKIFIISKDIFIKKINYK